MSNIVPKKKIAVLGGDLRQVVAAKELALDGWPVSLYAADTYTEELGAVTKAETLSEALAQAAFVVLPLPVTQDDERLHCPLTKKTVLLDDVFRMIPPGAQVVGGKLSDGVYQRAKAHALPIRDYLEREELAVANAVPTAEGALAIAMAEVPYTIKGAKCLVLGHGRIGRTLAPLLRAVGADVTVAARKPEELAWIRAEGCTALPFEKFLSEETEKPYDFDIVFNTVPKPILDAGMLARLRKETLLLDLASAPGGIDRKYAGEHGYHAVWALSLPGKTAPVTAGRIIKDTVAAMLCEEM